jgi:hypothetical protein
VDNSLRNPHKHEGSLGRPLDDNPETTVLTLQEKSVCLSK